MLIAWMILVPIGMIIARYFQFIFPENRIFEFKIWFSLHVPIMLLVVLITIVSLLAIVAEKNWTWISKNSLNAFVHSIFGMIVIGLLLLQVLNQF